MYECMYRECSKEWAYKPYKRTLEKHLIAQHYVIVHRLSETDFEQLVKAFEMSIGRQHKGLM